MKRLVSFSVAAMMAMGMTAGAAYQNTQVVRYTWSSNQQNMSADQIWQQLLDKYGIAGDSKPGCGPNTGSGNTGSNGGNGSNTGSGNTGSNGGNGSNTGSGNTGSNGGNGSNTGSGNTGSNGNSGSDSKPNTGGSTDSSDNTSSQSSFAAQVVSLVNAERAKNGLSALKVDNRVTAAAQTRAGELKSSFSHSRPDGRSCFTALTEAGASYRGAGENIAYGQTSPQAVMNAWMNSSGHRANILSNKYTTIGIGYTMIGGVPYWTQMFTY